MLFAVGKGSHGIRFPSGVLSGMARIGFHPAQACPRRAGHSGGLHGVWGASLNDIYAVGYGGGTGFTNMPLVFHWNGSSWSSQGSDPAYGYNHAQLWDIWGSASNDIYAAGIRPGRAGLQTCLCYFHYNGTGWSPITPP